MQKRTTSEKQVCVCVCMCACVHVHTCMCVCVCVCVQGILCLLFLRFRVYTLYVGHDLGKHSVLTLLMRCHNYRNDHYDQMPVNSNRTRLWMIEMTTMIKCQLTVTGHGFG